MTATATAERTATVQWSDALCLDLDFMDDTHREFIDLLAAIEVAADDRVVDCFAAMIEHTDGHFGAEDQWMKDTQFSSSNCHTMQHNVVMQVLREHGLSGFACDTDTFEIRRFIERRQQFAAYRPAPVDFFIVLGHHRFLVGLNLGFRRGRFDRLCCSRLRRRRR